MNRFYQLGGFLQSFGKDFKAFGSNPFTPGGMAAMGLNLFANNIAERKNDSDAYGYQNQWIRNHGQPSMVTNPYAYGNPNVMRSGGIHIKPENKGKFTEYKKRTGKTTAEALHSPNAHVRQMANFARNVKKWHHQDGGAVDYDHQDWGNGYGLYDDATMTGYNPTFQVGGAIPLSKYITPNNSSIVNPSFNNSDISKLYNPDESVRNWYVDYINSPKYKERLQNAGYTNVNNTIHDRRDRVKDAHILSSNNGNNSESYYDAANNNIFMDNQQVNDLSTNRDDILSHEFGHTINSVIGDIKNNAKNGIQKAPSTLRLNPYEEDYIANRNKNLYPGLISKAKSLAKDKDESMSHILTLLNHDMAPTENKSDVDAFRYILNREGIYDAGTQDFTPELLQKAKSNKKIKDTFNSQRLFNNFSDKDIIDIMNNIAGNPNNNLQTAKEGGLSRGEDYGSKQKPYPSVSSNDFAGEGRSYPIPTRTDAVDALRLAGLHGRDDVRAKVYAKYPDLKKQDGGQMMPFVPEYMIGGPIPFGYRISHENGELYKAPDGGPVPMVPPTKDQFEQARIAKLVQLSQQYGVPTNQIYTQTMRDQVDRAPNADIRYVQYQFMNPKSGKQETLREYNNKVKGTNYQHGGFVKGQSYNLTKAQIKDLQNQGYELEFI